MKVPVSARNVDYQKVQRAETHELPKVQMFIPNYAYPPRLRGCQVCLEILRKPSFSLYFNSSPSGPITETPVYQNKE